MGIHPVAVVQYTYTHKQYRERHKTNNTKNTKIHRTTHKIHRATQQLGRVGAKISNQTTTQKNHSLQIQQLVLSLQDSIHHYIYPKRNYLSFYEVDVVVNIFYPFGNLFLY